MPSLLAVCVGRPREFVRANGARASSAIWKAPVEGRVRAAGVNLDGDEQANLSVHGGFDKAVYSYAREDAAWWAGELGRELGPGAFGENLLTDGVDVTGAVVGERWRVGGVELEVSEPRLPCFKLAHVMAGGDPAFVERFGAAGRPGAYLRILRAGELGAGDEIEVVDRPGHGLSVAEAARIRLTPGADRSLLLAAVELPEAWHAWARGRGA